MSDFSDKFYTGHPRFYSFRALGSLQFPLEHSLGVADFFRAKWNDVDISTRLHYSQSVFVRIWSIYDSCGPSMVDSWITCERKTSWVNHYDLNVFILYATTTIFISLCLILARKILFHVDTPYPLEIFFPFNFAPICGGDNGYFLEWDNSHELPYVFGIILSPHC